MKKFGLIGFPLGHSFSKNNAINSYAMLHVIYRLNLFGA